MTTLIEATSDADFATAQTLFEEYATAIGIDLTFQNFAEELSRLRDTYGAPHGCLLLARHDQNVIGCVGLRPFGPGVCEMKRLYVRPAARGLKVGHQLAVEVIERARALGYRRMVLDTLASMVAAESLYRSLGFRDIAPYYTNPLPNAVYLELELSRGSAPAI